MLWQITAGLLGVLCLIYYALICRLIGRWNSTFSRFWLALGILALLASCVVRQADYQQLLNKVLLVLLVIFLVTEFLIIRYMIPGKERNYSYLIVLGAHVEGRRITNSLRRRLDRAAEYAKAHPQVVVIVSGGQGEGEDITEAEAMEEYLLEKGILGNHIRKEDKSKSTEENLKFSMKYIDNLSGKTGIVSNNFHVYRAYCYAKKLGYKSVYPLPVGCHPLLFVNYMVREFFALWKMWISSLKNRMG